MDHDSQTSGSGFGARDHRQSETCAIGACGSEGVSEELLSRIDGMCRKYAHDPNDIADAKQEVVLRYLRHRNRIELNVFGWLAATARSVCADIGRHRAREWRRRAEWSLRESRGDRDQASIIREQIASVMRSLDDDDRALIERRFFERLTIEAIASWLGVSPATASRRVGSAVERLGALLDVIDERVFVPPADAVLRGRARDSEREEETALSTQTVRVGVMVSELAMKTPTDEGWHIGIEGQVRSVPMLERDGIELVGMVEPDTTSIGGVERVIRDFGLGAHIVDATDARALYRELDVIYLGTLIAMVPRVLDAVVRAVELGVGLLNEHFAGSIIPGMRDQRVLRLMLAERAAEHHTEGEHGKPRPAEVVRGHEIIPGLSVGTRFVVGGCGPVCAMAKGSTVLIERADRPAPTHQAELLPNGGIMPILATGVIGGGRAVVLNQFLPELIGKHPSYRGDFYVNVCRWLARAEHEGSRWMLRTPARS
ncbi:MAG: sigma-70 family RNA polymerase sigma factor [Planctomycetota bacterium]